MEACRFWKDFCLLFFFKIFSQDIRTWNILCFLRNKATNNPLGPISEIYTTEWFHILCLCFQWPPVQLSAEDWSVSDPIVVPKYSLQLLLAKKLKSFPVSPYHFMELYYHLTMVTCLSSPFNQTSGAEEEVFRFLYVCPAVSYSTTCCQREFWERQEFAAATTKGLDLQGFFGGWDCKMDCNIETFIEGGFSFNSVLWKEVLTACINESEKGLYCTAHLHFYCRLHWYARHKVYSVQTV